MRHSIKLMWACVAVLVAVLALALAGANVAYGLFALPCVLMMGAMAWMMVRGMRGSGGTGHGN